MNDDVISLLEEIKQLLTLKGENPFKIRAFENAARVLVTEKNLKERAQNQTLTEIPGIGKGISETLTEFLLHGTSKQKEELIASLPPGLLEFTSLPGIGPKKAHHLIEELNISSLAELEYACRENRLLKLKGFGEKIQTKLLEDIAFLKKSSGQKLLPDAMKKCEVFLDAFKKKFPHLTAVETGSIRRRCETISQLELLVKISDPDGLQSKIETWVNAFSRKSPEILPIRLHFTTEEKFGSDLAKTTASDYHLESLGETSGFSSKTEEEFYVHLKCPVIPPELRETGEEVAMAKKGYLKELLPQDGVQGFFHVHTNRSDGSDTLETMVAHAKNLHYKYIGISDHSQSAFYAQGLKLQDLEEQEKEIKQVQKKHPDIRIFWGIESDILVDGSLDYEPDVLKKFDFVIASIHSRFKMTKDEMTYRMLKAIENPHTTMIGHLTGRILLGRKGYELDFDAIFKHCALYGVAIELNANPARLDVDWRWGGLLRKYGTLVAINPDAHELKGLSDTDYGVMMARKAMLPKTQILNVRSTSEIEKWLQL